MVDRDSSTAPFGKILALIDLAEPTSGGADVPQGTQNRLET
jgi:hypothetical protein